MPSFDFGRYNPFNIFNIFKFHFILQYTSRSLYISLIYTYICYTEREEERESFAFYLHFLLKRYFIISFNFVIYDTRVIIFISLSLPLTRIFSRFTTDEIIAISYCNIIKFNNFLFFFHIF